MSSASIKSFFKPLNPPVSPPAPGDRRSDKPSKPDPLPVPKSPNLELGASPILSGSVCKGAKELSADTPILRGRKRKSRARYLDSDSEEDIAETQTIKISERKLAKVRVDLIKREKETEKSKAFEGFKSPDNPLAMVTSPMSTAVTPSPKLTPAMSKGMKKLKISGGGAVPSNNGGETGQNIVTPDLPKSENAMDTCLGGLDLVTESPVPKEEACNPDSKPILSASTAPKPALVSESDYAPDQQRYHPVNSACWDTGTPVPYLALARTFLAIESTSSRLRIQTILCNYLRSVLALSSTEELLCSVYLTLNRLGPAWSGEELGVGEGALIRSLVQSTGRTQKAIKAQLAEVGDIGIVAESSRCTQKMMFKPAPLTVKAVFSKLQEVARCTGVSSQQKKVEKISSLLVSCREMEARYLIRGLTGKLRIRLQEQTVLTSLAHASLHHETEREERNVKMEALKERLGEAEQRLKSAYCQLPDYERVIPALLRHGLEALSDHCSLTPGIPLKPMLAQPTKGLSEIFKRVDQAAISCEYKYDGERAQIHVISPGEVRIFSRNQEEMTGRFPDVIERIHRHLGENVTSCVLDSEVVARDTEKNQKLPFQVLTTRKRKGVSLEEIKVQVCVFAFDLLYLNGESLVHEPFRKRSEILRNSFRPVEGEFSFSERKITNCTEEIQQFFEGSLKDQCEGLMIKTLDHNATYEISKRSFNWLKLKKDYLEGTGDTMDLLVVGAYLGTGKRTGHYGGFLLSCYEPDSEEYQAICKTGTGFSEAQLEAQYNLLKEHVIPRPKPYYNLGTCPAPDVWFDSKYVWEVKAADLSLSPIYPAAIGLADPERGISLRFPRFVRTREDKSPEDATSAEQIAQMYLSQQSVAATIGPAKHGDDYY